MTSSNLFKTFINQPNTEDQHLRVAAIERAIEDNAVVFSHPNVLAIESVDFIDCTCVLSTNCEEFVAVSPVVSFHVVEPNVFVHFHDVFTKHKPLPNALTDNPREVRLTQVYYGGDDPFEINNLTRKVLPVKGYFGKTSTTPDFEVVDVEVGGVIRLMLLNDKHTAKEISEKYYARMEGDLHPSLENGKFVGLVSKSIKSVKLVLASVEDTHNAARLRYKQNPEW